ncbi:MAG: DivIVA domain-containing protein [Cryobacterium sp.]
MRTTFTLTDKKTRGYVVTQVDDFLARARSAYDDTADAADLVADAELAAADVPIAIAVNHPTSLTAQIIRHTAFAMHKGGYVPAEVDAALERLEDAFAARERELAIAELGPEAWEARTQAAGMVIQARLERPRGHRFTRTSFLVVGYRRADVDRFARRLERYFRGSADLTRDEVRTVVFRPERGGYREDQVDALLDGVVDVMLAVR